MAGCEQPQARIGVVLPLTGADAALGQAARRGLDASLGQLGDTTMVIDVRDSGSDPAEARRQLDALIDEGAVATIGGLTPREARALAATSDARERVLLMPSASEQSLSAESKWVYRLTASDADAGSAFASFADRRLKAKTALLLAHDNAQGQALEAGFTSTFESLGGAVSHRFFTEGSPSEDGVSFEDAVKARPDLAVLAGDAAWQTATIGRLHAAGFKGHIFGARHLAHPEALADLPKKDRVLFAHTGFDPGASKDAVRSFVERFQDLHGEAPSGVTAQIAAETWDAIQVLALALENRPPLPSEIRRGLRDEVKAFAGASGSLEFDDTGAVTGFPRVYSVAANGQLRDHGAFLDAEAEKVAEQRRALQEKLQKLQASMAGESKEGEPTSPGA